MHALDSVGDSLIDLAPIVMAAYVLYGSFVGMGGVAEAAREPEATSVLVAIAGLLLGFERSRRRSTLPLGVGIFACAFALTLAGLAFV